MSLNLLLPIELNFIRYIKEDEWFKDLEEKKPNGELLVLFLKTIVEQRDRIESSQFDKWFSISCSLLQEKENAGILSKKAEDLFHQILMMQVEEKEPSSKRQKQKNAVSSEFTLEGLPLEIKGEIAEKLKGNALKNFLTLSKEFAKSRVKLLNKNEKAVLKILEKYNYDIDAIPKKLLADLQANSPSIQSLHFNINTISCTPEKFEKILEHFPHITALGLQGVDVSDVIIKKVITDKLLSKVASLKSLKELTVWSEVITGASLSTITKQCKELKSLNLPACRSLKDQDLAAFLRNCSGLLKLCLLNNPQFTDNSISLIAICCPRLQSLNLDNSKITDKSLQALADGCKDLEIIDLQWCKNITDGGVSAFVKNAHNLQVLNLSMTDISDKALFVVAEHGKKLKKIELYSCRNIRDLGVETIAKNLKNLQSINLESVTQLTDNALFSIATHCPDLEEINLRECFGITDASVLAICTHCKKLKDLDLFGCKITDASLQAIAENCKALKSLNLTYCKVSEKQVEELKKLLPHLKIAYL